MKAWIWNHHNIEMNHFGSLTKNSSPCEVLKSSKISLGLKALLDTIVCVSFKIGRAAQFNLKSWPKPFTNLSNLLQTPQNTSSHPSNTKKKRNSCISEFICVLVHNWYFINFLNKYLDEMLTISICFVFPPRHNPASIIEVKQALGSGVPEGW